MNRLYEFDITGYKVLDSNKRTVNELWDWLTNDIKEFQEIFNLDFPDGKVTLYITKTKIYLKVYYERN